jgi:hypothetical protein
LLSIYVISGKITRGFFSGLSPKFWLSRLTVSGLKKMDIRRPYKNAQDPLCSLQDFPKHGSGVQWCRKLIIIPTTIDHRRYALKIHASGGWHSGRYSSAG